ncbi:MAG: hypothetical protein AAGC97_06740 [Planctomycetota bacterium]
MNIPNIWSIPLTSVARNRIQASTALIVAVLCRWRQEWLLVITLVFAGCGGPSTQDRMMEIAKARAALAEQEEAEEAEEAKVAKVTSPSPKESSTPPVPKAVAMDAGEPVPVVDDPPSAPEPTSVSIPVPTQTAGFVAGGMPTDDPKALDNGPQTIDARSSSWPTDRLGRWTKVAESLTTMAEGVRKTRNRQLMNLSDIHDPAGNPLLSWRVAMLPRIGYQDLYDRFEIQEPWNSATNIKLLPLIPDVFVCDSLIDERSDYFIPSGPDTYGGIEHRQVDLRASEDAAVLCIIRGEPSDAVPWTKPGGLDIDQAKLVELTKSQQSGGCFGVTIFGRAVRLRPDLPGKEMVASVFYRPEGSDDRLESIDIARAPYEFKTAGQEVTLVDYEAGRTPNLASAPGSAGNVSTMTPSGADLSQPVSVPDPSSLLSARRTAKELFGQRYQQASPGRQRERLLAEMFAMTHQMDDDAAGRYVMLESVRNGALANLSFEYFWKATLSINTNFYVDRALQPSPSILQFGGRLLKAPSKVGGGEFVTESLRQVADSVLQDRYEDATRIVEVLVQLTEANVSNLAPAALQYLQQSLADARSRYEPVEQAIDALVDGTATIEQFRTAGSYFCFVKGQWNEGSQHLSRADGSLQKAALVELESPNTGDEFLLAGDAWWAVADESVDMIVTDAARQRACHWYQQAERQLTSSLQRMKVRKRLDASASRSSGNVLEQIASLASS